MLTQTEGIVEDGIFLPSDGFNLSEMIFSWLRNKMDIPAVFTFVAMGAIFLVLCYIAVMVTYGVWILRQVYDKWVDLW